MCTSPPHRKATRTWLSTLLTENWTEDASHPLQIAARTYTLSLTLSLLPALLPFVLAALRGKASRTSSFRQTLKRELSPSGFAFAITVAVGGGAALQRIWQTLEEAHDCDSLDEQYVSSTFGEGDKSLSVSLLNRLVRWSRSLNLSPSQKSTISNLLSSTLAMALLHSAKRRTRAASPVDVPLTVPMEMSASGPPVTLDLTILLVVRAIDARIQSLVFRRSKIRTESNGSSTLKLSVVDAALEAEVKQRQELKWREKMTTTIDALIFWACCSRIMWCFFYDPSRLPSAYVKWIGKLAAVDSRIVATLQAIRHKQWSYITGSEKCHEIMYSLARELKLPTAVADPIETPAFGGVEASLVWKQLGIHRHGVGGVPCEMVHGTMATNMGFGHDCYSNVAARFLTGFMQALPIYLSAHFIPVLLTRPSSILKPHRVFYTLTGVIRSSTFLASFISLYWSGVCLTRSVLLAKIFPWISHDFWDGPFGGIFAGSLICGSSIFIENERRRGEMALYVVPRAIRAVLPMKWVRSGSWGITITERIVFIVSLASLLTTAMYQPNSLRGLSRWVLAFIMRGPNAGFWLRRKRQLTTAPPSPGDKGTPQVYSPRNIS